VRNIRRGYGTWAKEFEQRLARIIQICTFSVTETRKSARIRRESSAGSYEIVTTRFYDGVPPSSDSNVRGRRCARVCGRG